MEWLKIDTPQGTQYFRTSQIVGILPVSENGVARLGMCALIVQNLPGPCIVGMSQQQVLNAIGGDAPPTRREPKNEMEMLAVLSAQPERMLTLRFNHFDCEYVAYYGSGVKPSRKYTGVTIEECIRNMWGHEKP